MDKITADITACTESIRNKLHAVPILTQLPIGHGKEFKGVIDLVSMEAYMWDTSHSGDGQNFVKRSIAANPGEKYVSALEARNSMIETIADLDDTIAERLLSLEDPNKITAEELRQSLRQLTLEHKGIPVLLGSAFKKKGIQLLLDSVIDYLPSPSDTKYSFAELYGQKLCALAFKTIHDKQRGPLSYLRVYSGTVSPNTHIYNVSRHCGEHIQKVYQAYSEEYKEVREASTGNIAVVTGLKHTVTGDTLAESASVTKAAHKRADVQSEDPSVTVLAGMSVPEPVFFCTIEPASLAYEKPLEIALENLKKEDPSLRVSLDQETGQTTLSGMGELHLEIILDRIRKEYKVDCDLGPLQIAYRETVLLEVKKTVILDRLLGDIKHHVVMTLSVTPSSGAGVVERLRLVNTKDTNLTTIRRDYLQAIERGVISACMYGPLLGFKVTDVIIGLHALEVGPRTSAAMISSCASECVSQALQDAIIQVGNKSVLHDHSVFIVQSTPHKL